MAIVIRPTLIVNKAEYDKIVKLVPVNAEDAANGLAAIIGDECVKLLKPFGSFLYACPYEPTDEKGVPRSMTVFSL